MRLAIKKGKVDCPRMDRPADVKKDCRGGFSHLHRKECDHFGWEENNECVVCRYSEERERRLNGKYLTV